MLKKCQINLLSVKQHLKALSKERNKLKFDTTADLKNNISMLNISNLLKHDESVMLSKSMQADLK